MLMKLNHILFLLVLIGRMFIIGSFFLLILFFIFIKRKLEPPLPSLKLKINVKYGKTVFDVSDEAYT